MRCALRASLDCVDRHWARAWTSAGFSASHLLVGLVHAMHRPGMQDPDHALASHDPLCPDDLRRYLDAVLRAGYRAVDGNDVLQSPDAPGRRFWLTFDDGYFNNSWALPVLQEFHVPATFFISTGHVLERKSFWWDVVARRLAGQGRSRRQIGRKLERLKEHPTPELETRLRDAWGAAALQPAGDIDRPFEEGELRDFARSRWVSLGNHTAQHTILTRCSPAESVREIEAGRRALEAITAQRCEAIAYPNGDYTAQVVDAARASGHRLGLTCDPRANAPGPSPDGLLTLGRHAVPSGADYRALLAQCGTPRPLPGARLRALARRLA